MATHQIGVLAWQAPVCVVIGEAVVGGAEVVVGGAEVVVGAAGVPMGWKYHLETSLRAASFWVGA